MGLGPLVELGWNTEAGPCAAARLAGSKEAGLCDLAREASQRSGARSTHACERSSWTKQWTTTVGRTPAVEEKVNGDARDPRGSGEVGEVRRARNGAGKEGWARVHGVGKARILSRRRGGGAWLRSSGMVSSSTGVFGGMELRVGVHGDAEDGDGLETAGEGVLD